MQISETTSSCQIPETRKCLLLAVLNCTLFHLHYLTGRLLQRRWKSLRDCYTREVNSKQKSGSAASGRKQYVFFSQLSFLKPATTNKVTVSNLDGDENGDGEKQQQHQDSQETPSRSPAYKRKRYGGLPSEQRLYDVLAKSVETRMENQKLLEDDDDRLFLLSLVKEMKKVPEHLKIEAKFDILNVFKKYQTKYTFPHPVSQFHHAPGPSHCYPCNPSNPASFQVPYQDSNTRSVEIMPRYNRYPFTEPGPSFTPEPVSRTQTPHASATSDLSYTNSPDPSHSDSEIVDVCQE